MCCDRPDSLDAIGVARRDPGDPRGRPGYVIDSLLPPGEALRRFRVGLDSTVTLDGPRSRDDLVQRFFVALAARDRPALEALAINRAEFAWVVFPDSRVSRPPYNQPPDIGWLLLQSSSAGGLTKLLARADRLAPAAGYRCQAPAVVDGAVRLWTACVVRAREGGHARDIRLFGTIVEHRGRYKFVGFDSDL